MANERTSYWDYIRVEELLGLQGGVERDERELSTDEVRFIVIHQIDELWMKLAIRELAAARDLFRLEHVPETSLSAASAGLRRIALVFELMADHFRLMETMRTQDYLRFRDKLSPASGFQSAQLREIEILMGLDETERLAFGGEDSYKAVLREPDGAASPALARVEARLADVPSLKDAIYAWLARAPIHGSVAGAPGDDDVVTGYIDEFMACMRRAQDARMAENLGKQAWGDTDVARLRARYEAEVAQAEAYLRAEDVADADARNRVRRLRVAILFIDSNRQLPLLSWPSEIIDGLIAVEQSMLVFRQRHARMVERVIGRRVGTGGSAGVEYLDQTALAYRIFKEIWAARSMLMAPDSMPGVDRPDFYGLRSES